MVVLELELKLSLGSDDRRGQMPEAEEIDGRW